MYKVLKLICKINTIKANNILNNFTYFIIYFSFLAKIIKINIYKNLYKILYF